MKITETRRQNILTEISLYELNCNLIRPDLTPNEAVLFGHLERLKYHLYEKDELPSPLILLEIFLFSHGSEFPVPVFILDWLYNGAIAYHQHEGLVHLEKCLGFTSGKGANSGQGHEFRKAIREQYLNRQRLFMLIRCLYMFQKYSRDAAVEIVHRLHKRETKNAKKRHRKPLSLETISQEYNGWKGKQFFDQNLEAFREKWKTAWPGWQDILQTLENEGGPLPKPKI